MKEIAAAIVAVAAIAADVALVATGHGADQTGLLVGFAVIAALCAAVIA